MSTHRTEKGNSVFRQKKKKTSGWWNLAKDAKGKSPCSCLDHAPTHGYLGYPRSGAGRRQGRDLSTGSSLWRLSQNPRSPPSALQTSASWPPDHVCWSHGFGAPCRPRGCRSACRSQAGCGHQGAVAWSRRWACARRSRPSRWSRGCPRPPAMPRRPRSPPGPLMHEEAGAWRHTWTRAPTDGRADVTWTFRKKKTRSCAQTHMRTNRNHQCQSRNNKDKKNI